MFAIVGGEVGGLIGFGVLEILMLSGSIVMGIGRCFFRRCFRGLKKVSIRGSCCICAAVLSIACFRYISVLRIQCWRRDVLYSNIVSIGTSKYERSR